MGKKQQGHRQRGAGTVTVSKGEQLRQGVMCKEWQRTPIQLLHEYCQSKKRDKPIYSRVRAPDGRFRMRCILPDVKNTSKDLTFSTEQDFETMDEAKHCSALLALKHVEPLRPYEQKLPDPYRDLWLTLDNSKSTVTATIATSKKKDSKTSATTVKNKNDQKIPPPPASAASSSSTAERLDEQEDNMDLWQSTCDDDDEEEQDEKKNKFPIELTADRKFASKAEFMQAQLQRQQAKNKKRRQRENRDRANMLKQVFMSTECREKIEGILKRLSPIQAQGAIFPPIDMDSKELKEIDGHEEFYRKVSEKLLSIGFLSNHAQGAIQNCQRQPNHSSEEYMTMILDWLCLHVPEEELPREFNPQGTQMDAIIHQKKSTSNHQLSISLSIGTKLIQRLMKYGYDRLDAIQVINEYFKNSQLKEDQAKLLPIEESTWKLVEILFTRLLTYHLEFDMKKIVTSSVEEKEIELLRQDEIFALEAIYMDTMQQKTLLNGDLILQVPASEHVMLEIYLPKKSKYPYELPMIAVRVAEEEDLAHPQAVLQGTREALKSCINSIGEPMIYDICVSVDNYLRQANKGRVIDKIILYPEETKISEKLVGTSSEVSSVPAPPPPTATTKSAKIKPSNRKHGHGSSGASPAKIQALSDMLLNQHKAKLETKEYQDMQSKRNTLPAAAEKTRILQLLHNNQVLLIAGQTGCGKTTQVPQFILDEYIQKGQGGACEIICTQPRRIAAIGVATRVAEERCEQVSDVVGYQIRMEAKRSTLTRLLFCTTGVLLRRLLNDRSLQGVSHVIVDEVHERNVDTDFLLSVLRDLLPQRPDLRLILMSATMNAELFVNYFSTKNTTKKCPVLKIPGFTYPVESFYLEDIVKQTQYNIPRHMLKKKTSKDHENKEEATDVKGVEEELWTRFDDSHIDYDLFVHVVTYLIEQQEQKSQNLGSILVFLPGTAEIKRLIEAFSQSKEISSKIWALPLHGSLSASDQSVVFRNAPKGKYKIIVSTNIAETSITINDVTAVLDCGKLKEMVYDSTNRRSQLLDTWASKAGCDQRKGRAGRVQAGQCYRFFTKKRWSNLANQLAAEIHRVSLEQLCLQIKKLELGPIRKFLSKAIEPPEEHAVDAAIQGLLEIGAFTRQQKGQHEVSLTPLGNHLAMLPMDARLGKFLVFGSILRCVEPVAMIASCISNRSPFTMTSDPEIRAKQEQTKKEMVIGHSDHLLMWKLMEAYHELKGQKNKRTFCKEKGVSFEAMETILDLKDQYLTQLETIGFYETKSVDNHWNENAKTPRIIKAALCAGLFANVIQVWYPEQKYFQSAHGVFTEQHEAKKLSYWIRSTPSSSDDHSPSQTRERVFLHPTSCNFQANQYDSPWLLYSDLVQTSKLFVRDSTMVHPYALLLFGDQLKVVHEQGELHLLEGWIRFKAVARIGVLIKSIRLHLDQLLLEKIETPQLDIAQSELITAIGYLLTNEGM